MTSAQMYLDINATPDLNDSELVFFLLGKNIQNLLQGVY